MTEAPAHQSQLGVFRKWILERFALVDWRKADERKMAYHLISDAIDRMRPDVFDAEVISRYRQTLAQLRDQIEAKAGECATLADLANALDGEADDATDARRSPLGTLQTEELTSQLAATPIRHADRSAEPASSDRAAASRDTEQRLSSSMSPLRGKLERLYPYRQIALTAASLVLALVAILLATVPMASRPECGPISTTCFDSGWQAVSSRTTTVYFFRHRLGAAPKTISLWFSPSVDGTNAFPLVWRFPRNESGNPVSVEVKSDVVLVNIWNGVPLFGAYDASNDRWTTYTDGFYRVVVKN